jgi:hypothetical protein
MERSVVKRIRQGGADAIIATCEGRFAEAGEMLAA